MPTRRHKLAHLLALTRPALALTAVSNSWLTVFLVMGLDPAARQPGYTGWWLAAALGLAGVVSAGLHVHGMALNDLFDARHDRLFSPHRPIPAGGVAPNTAIVLALLCLLAAVLAALFLQPRSIILCILAAVGILFYNATGKFLPAAGILALGAIRALNMLLPVPQVGLLWPLWLMTTHVMFCWAIAHSLEGKRPRLHAGGWWLVLAGWAFWTLVLLVWMRRHDALWVHGRPGLWIGPLAAGAVFLVAAWRLLRGQPQPRARRAAGAAFLRLAMLWLIVYDASWLLGAGLWWQGAVHVGLLAAAVLAMRVTDALSQAASSAPNHRLHEPGPVAAGP